MQVIDFLKVIGDSIYNLVFQWSKFCYFFFTKYIPYSILDFGISRYKQEPTRMIWPILMSRQEYYVITTARLSYEYRHNKFLRRCTLYWNKVLCRYQKPKTKVQWPITQYYFIWSKNLIIPLIILEKNDIQPLDAIITKFKLTEASTTFISFKFVPT